MSNNKKFPTSYVSPKVSNIRIFYFPRDPLTTDFRNPFDGKYYGIGDEWQNKSSGSIFKLFSITANVADWVLIGTGDSSLLSASADSGVAIPNASGNINFFGQNVAGSGIQTSATGSTVSYRMLSPYALGDFEFTGGNVAVTRSNSGGINQVAVVNGSNTAGSVARMIVQNAGGSGGDVVFTYAISGGGAWSTGIDVSVDGSLVFCPAVTLTGTNVLVLAPGGNVSVPLGDFKVSRSFSGNIVRSEVANDSNTAGSDAVMLASVAGTSAGDPYTRYNVSGAGVWSAGIDNSDSDAYVVSNSAVPGTNNAIRATTGSMAFPNAGLTTGAGIYSAASGALTSMPGGSFTFVGGTTASIPVPAITVNSVVTYCTVTLGTVTTVQGILTTITPGVGFVPTSNDATDTSTIKWSIVRL